MSTPTEPTANPAGTPSSVAAPQVAEPVKPKSAAPTAPAKTDEPVEATGVYGNVYDLKPNTDPDYSPEPAGELNTSMSEFPHQHDGQVCEVCEDPDQTHDEDGMPVDVVHEDDVAN